MSKDAAPIALSDRHLIAFERKVFPDPNSGCWLWGGSLNGSGYGEFYHGGGKKSAAHRIAFWAFVGAIPDGMVIDHLCRVRCCVNPQHLELVSNRENVKRGAHLKTHCPSGHPYAGDNLILYRGGQRRCRECTRRHGRVHQAKKRRSLTQKGTQE